MQPSTVWLSGSGQRTPRAGFTDADAFTIQKLAGHSSITISQRYVHADCEIKESAIRLLDVLNQPKIEG
jgi:integrase